MKREKRLDHSFGIVEEKLSEAEFFLDSLRASGRLQPEPRYFFSAFVSAARSVTDAIRASLVDTPSFDAWYANAMGALTADPLTKHFAEIRNKVIHTGDNPLNRVPLEHLREDLARQQQKGPHSHVLVLPAGCQADGKTVLADAVEICTTYFISLVSLVYNCYLEFKTTVDPRWYYTKSNFTRRNLTLKDAVSELGFPPAWASCAPSEDAAWRVLRSQQPPCLLNGFFDRYLGQTIRDPDEDDEQGAGPN